MVTGLADNSLTLSVVAAFILQNCSHLNYSVTCRQEDINDRVFKSTVDWLNIL